MLFFWSRKSEPVVDAGSSTTAPVATAGTLHFQFPPKQQQQHTPSPSIDSSSSQVKDKKCPSPTASDMLPPPGPLDSPSPGLPGVIDKGDAETADPSALHALIASVPPQTLHAYTLAYLSPVPPSPFPFANPAAGLILHTPPIPPSPRTISVLTEFFSQLTPPPKLHCVRCHKGYFELENTDQSCRVPHDDDSAIVNKLRTGEHETLYECCGKTAEGDGDQGPPDGWCYEGRHTTDVKRARFRADSTPHDDKLTSCAQLRCGEPPLPRRGSRASRKRTRDNIEDAEDSPSVASSSHSRTLSKRHNKSASIASSTKFIVEEDKPRPTKRPRSRKASSVSFSKEVDGDAMDVDDDGAPPPVSSVHPSPPKSPRRPPASTASNTSNAVKSRMKPNRKASGSSSPKPRSKGTPGTTVPLQKSPLSSSFTAPMSGNNTDASSRPGTPTRKGNRVEVEILTKSPSRVGLGGSDDSAKKHALSKKESVNSLKLGKSDSAVSSRSTAALKNGNIMKGRSDSAAPASKSRRAKKLSEVVHSSIDGEKEWA